MEEIFQSGLHEFIDEFIDDNNRLGAAITRAISDVSARMRLTQSPMLDNCRAVSCPVDAMRMRIAHATTYRYDAPPTSVIQMLRLTPRNHEGQYVVDWRIDVSADCRLDAARGRVRQHHPRLHRRRPARAS